LSHVSSPSPGWPGTCDPPASSCSPPWILACATMTHLPAFKNKNKLESNMRIGNLGVHFSTKGSNVLWNICINFMKCVYIKCLYSELGCFRNTVVTLQWSKSGRSSLASESQKAVLFPIAHVCVMPDFLHVLQPKHLPTDSM
jgi:hypothetical protein